MTVPTVARQLRYRRKVGRLLVAAAVVIAALSTASPALADDPQIVRLGGANRFDTAVEVSKHHHPGGADLVIVASGTDFPDGLAGAAVAGRLGAPVLLTRPATLPQATRDEIIRLDPDTILLLGGTAAVSDAVAAELATLAPTTRLAGADRYATAVAVSQHAFPTAGSADTVVVATGADFPDALAGAAAAAALDGPVLLTRPGELPQATRDEIIRLDPDTILLLGGTAAVSDAVAAELATLAPTTRLAGADRYATAVAVSQHAFAGSPAVYIATGENFPDTLAGAAGAASAGAPVLLTQTNSLPAPTRAEMVRLEPDTAVILGGLAAVGLVPEHRIAHPDLPTLAEIQVGLTDVASGFTQPLFVTDRPGDARLYVVEQRGRIWSMNDDGTDRVTVLDIEAKVEFFGERGLLGIAFHPTEPERLIVHYSSATSDPKGHTTIEEYAFPLAAVAVTPEPVGTILTHEQFASNHNGGMIAFGPNGLLYIGLGDGGGSNDPGNHGQNASTLYGTILRIDVATLPYTIPAGNPFADGADGAPEVWAYGLRNPWRFSFDGDDLYIADVGQGDWEEVNLVTVADGGANLGWAVLEGTHCFKGPQALCDNNDFVDPIHEYAIRGVARCAVTGGYVYRGAEFLGLAGAYFFGDFCTGQIMALRTYKGVVVDSRVFPVAASQLSSFGVDGDGRLYATSFSGGRVLRLEQTG